MSPSPFNVLIVGAGPAGIGAHLMLRQAGIPASQILHIDREGIGASFAHWPAQMRFITPSFTANTWGLADLNSIDPDTSPAFTLRTEHPTGRQYQQYLQAVASHYGIQVKKGSVHQVKKVDGIFHITLAKEHLTADRVIWAVGEYGYPKTDGFPGANLCVHNSQVKDWAELKGAQYHVIGGYESGIDAAYHLVKNGKEVVVYDSGHPWSSVDPDPSVSVSPYTLDRYHEIAQIARFTTRGGVKIKSVAQKSSGYVMTLSTGEHIETPTAPILATGFAGSLTLIRDLFHGSRLAL